MSKSQHCISFKYNKKKNSNRVLDLFIIFIIIGQAILYKEQLPYLNSFFVAAQSICFVVTFFYYITRKLKPNIYHWFWLIYILIVIYSSIINRVVYYGNILSPTIGAASLLMIFHMRCSSDLDGLLCNLTKVFFFYVVVNFLLVLLYPNGVWTDVTDVNRDEIGRYLIGGNRNQMGGTLIAAIVTSVAYSYKVSNNIRKSLGMLFFATLSVLIVGSKTSIIGFFAFILFLVFAKFRRFGIKELIVVFSLFCVVQILFLLSFDIISSNKFLGYIIEDVLQKDLTFSSRTTIWNFSIIMISMSPIFGYGWQDPEWNKFYIFGVSTHNLVLHVLIKGGIILLSCFIIVIGIAIKQAVKNATTPAILIHLGFWIFLFMMSTEVYNAVIIAYFITLLYSTRYFSENNRLQNKAH